MWAASTPATRLPSSLSPGRWGRGSAPGRGANSAAGAPCAARLRSRSPSVYAVSSALSPREGKGHSIPRLSPGPAEELKPGVWRRPFVPLPDALPRLSADGCWPGLQSFPAPSRPSRGKGLNRRVILLTACRGNAAAKRISAGRRAIGRALLPFRAQLRPPRARPSPRPGFRIPSALPGSESSFPRRP